MTASPIVLVADGGGPFTAFTDGKDVTPGNTISVKLQSTTDVTQWTLQIFGVDEVTATAPSLTGVNPTTHIVDSPGSTVTFTMPSGSGIGRALLFRSAVNGGGAGFTSNFGLYTLTTTSRRVGAVGERLEGDANFGWASTVNSIIRAGGGGGGLPPFANEQFAALMEDPAGVLVFQRITQDMIVGGGGVSYDVILDPNGVTDGNTYASIADLVAGTEDLDGFIRVTLLDTIATEPGNYDLSRYIFTNFSANENQVTGLNVISGTSIVLPRALNNVNINITAGGEVFTESNARISLLGNGGITKDPGAPSFGAIITIGGNLIDDGEGFTIDDGINPAVTFEFDMNSSVVETDTLRRVTITNVSTAGQVRDAVITAITNTPFLDITATISGPNHVQLESNHFSDANIPMSDTVDNPGFQVIGMDEGVADPPSIDIDGGTFFVDIFDQAYLALDVRSVNPLFTNGNLSVIAHSGASFNFNAADSQNAPLVSNSVTAYAGTAPFGNPQALFANASGFTMQKQTALLVRPDSITIDPLLAYGPPGWEYATYLALSSDAARTIKGLQGSSNVGPQNGFGSFERLKVVFNAGSFNLNFVHDSVDVDPQERVSISGGTDFALTPGSAALLLYDTATTDEANLNRWRMYPLSSGGSSGGMGDVQFDVTQTFNSDIPEILHTYTADDTEARGTICYEALVSSIGPGGGDYSCFKLVAIFERDGTSITEQDVTFINGPVRSSIDYDVTFGIDGLDINLQVLGQSNGNGGMRWRAVGFITAVNETFAEA